ncbi:MAG: hypothetical protein R3F59_14745 [Myxococcota bacterium]
MPCTTPPALTAIGARQVATPGEVQARESSSPAARGGLDVVAEPFVFDAWRPGTADLDGVPVEALSPTGDADLVAALAGPDEDFRGRALVLGDDAGSRADALFTALGGGAAALIRVTEAVDDDGSPLVEVGHLIDGVQLPAVAVDHATGEALRARFGQDVHLRVAPDPAPGHRSDNLVARIPGTGSRPGRVWVVAHYDSWHGAEMAFDNALAPPPDPARRPRRGAAPARPRRGRVPGHQRRGAGPAGRARVRRRPRGRDLRRRPGGGARRGLVGRGPAAGAGHHAGAAATRPATPRARPASTPPTAATRASAPTTSLARGAEAVMGRWPDPLPHRRRHARPARPRGRRARRGGPVDGPRGARRLGPVNPLRRWPGGCAPTAGSPAGSARGTAQPLPASSSTSPGPATCAASTATAAASRRPPAPP